MIGADIADLIAADGLVATYGHVSTRTRGFDPDHPAADLAIVTESAIVDAPLEASCCRRERPGRAPSLLASRSAFGIAIAAPTTQDQQEPGASGLERPDKPRHEPEAEQVLDELNQRGLLCGMREAVRDSSTTTKTDTQVIPS
jgi:hypothetical protein